MSRSRLPLLRPLLLLATGASSLLAVGAHAAVPTGYVGTPYMGTPQAIPGRVELANLDVGGEGKSYHADHRRVNAKAEGYSPISGDDYRPTEIDLPNICKTNKQNPDSYVGTNAPYPPTTPTKEVYYMGYAHAHDWVRMTVDVKVAGKYNVSSTWASANGQWGLSLWFNDGSNPALPMDGVNKSGKVVMPGTSDYHKWKDYPNFTQVDLTAGVQLLTFHLEQEDHLQYGFLQFDLVGGNPDGGVTGAAGSTGTAGASGGAAGSTGTAGATGSAGATGAAGVTGTAGTSGAAGETATGSAGSAGSTGSAGVTGGAAGVTGGAGTSGPKANGGDGGCACAVSARDGVPAGTLTLLALGGVLMAARRRRRR
jgi:MYXO-CTERM domain-containing protein